MSSTINTVAVSEQQNIKNTMQTKTTTVEIDDEIEEDFWFYFWCISLTILTFISYFLTLFLLISTSAALDEWQKQNMNYTNFEEIQMGHFRMHIIMDAYLLIITINFFFLELSGWGYHYFIQLWGTKEWKGSRFIGITLVHLTILVLNHIMPLISPPISKEKYLENEYTPSELEKLHFYFQLAAIWCILQLTFDHIVIDWLRARRDPEKKYGKTQSTVSV